MAIVLVVAVEATADEARGMDGKAVRVDDAAVVPAVTLPGENAAADGRNKVPVLTALTVATAVADANAGWAVAGTVLVAADGVAVGGGCVINFLTT